MEGARSGGPREHAPQGEPVSGPRGVGADIPRPQLENPPLARLVPTFAAPGVGVVVNAQSVEAFPCPCRRGSEPVCRRPCSSPPRRPAASCPRPGRTSWSRSSQPDRALVAERVEKGVLARVHEGEAVGRAVLWVDVDSELRAGGEAAGERPCGHIGAVPRSRERERSRRARRRPSRCSRSRRTRPCRRRPGRSRPR